MKGMTLICLFRMRKYNSACHAYLLEAASLAEAFVLQIDFSGFPDIEK